MVACTAQQGPHTNSMCVLQLLHGVDVVSLSFEDFERAQLIERDRLVQVLYADEGLLPLYSPVPPTLTTLVTCAIVDIVVVCLFPTVPSERQSSCRSM